MQDETNCILLRQKFSGLSQLSFRAAFMASLTANKQEAAMHKAGSPTATKLKISYDIYEEFVSKSSK